MKPKPNDRLPLSRKAKKKTSRFRKLSSAEALAINHRKGRYPYPAPLSAEEYDRAKVLLQAEMIKAQEWVRIEGHRILAVFEGRDAAGKGGTIKRLVEHLNPRHARVVALEKPSPAETGQWYFQRYVRHMPTRGQMVFFDRSWYNRAGVERVMGFCSAADYRLFLQHCPLFERMLVESGTILLKYWFSVSRLEQERRFRARETNPLKSWKLSPVDREALPRWDDYSTAKEAMFRDTDTEEAPWTIVKSDDKKRARINCLRHFLSQLDYPGKDPSVALPADRKIVHPAREVARGTDQQKA